MAHLVPRFKYTHPMVMFHGKLFNCQRIYHKKSPATIDFGTQLFPSISESFGTLGTLGEFPAMRNEAVSTNMFYNRPFKMIYHV